MFTLWFVPICRLMEMIVRSGLVMAWRFAVSPTIRSPSFLNPTTEGVVRLPSAFGMTTASPPSMTATQELVVPRSMPITLLIDRSSLMDCQNHELLQPLTLTMAGRIT